MDTPTTAQKLRIERAYRRIMTEEVNLRASANPGHIQGHTVPLTSLISHAAHRIALSARSSFEPRGYIVPYGLENPPQHFIIDPINPSRRHIVFESVAAHTNLLHVMVNCALDYIFGADFSESGSEWSHTPDGYTRHVINEVVNIHDLAENQTSDTLDNNSRDETAKIATEYEFFCTRIKPTYSSAEADFAAAVERLYKDFLEPTNPHTGFTARLLKCADKAAAVIITLEHDHLSIPPLLNVEYEKATERDREEMLACDFITPDGFCRASEMWTIDFFRCRNFIALDDYFYFTALIVFYTLMVHGRWYNWREQDYQNAKQ